MLPLLPPTRPPTLREPLTLPVAYDCVIVAWLLPTRPPTNSRAPLTAPLAVETLIRPLPELVPASPPTAAPPSELTPVTLPLAPEFLITPLLAPTRPPTALLPVTLALLNTLSSVPPSFNPTTAPTL